MSADEFLTANQVAARLSLSPRTIRSWARAGLIPVIRISPKVVRFDWKAVLAALRRNGTASELGGREA